MANNINEACDELKEALMTRKEIYGTSKMHPVSTFSTSTCLEQINVRIDDILNQIKVHQLAHIEHREEKDPAGEDLELDLMEYLIMKQLLRDQDK